MLTLNALIPEFDKALRSVFAKAPTASAFDAGTRTLAYSSMPLEQASNFNVSVRLVNRGRQVVPVTDDSRKKRSDCQG